MNKKYILAFIISFFIAFGAVAQEENGETVNKTEEYQAKDFTNSVVLQGINKITARVSTLTIKKDEKASFGNLEIELLKCWSAPPEQEPENKALLKVWEQIPGEEKKQIFFGWMFSSSPALSALEHPVYDVVVTECKNTDAPTGTTDTEGKDNSNGNS